MHAGGIVLISPTAIGLELLDACQENERIRNLNLWLAIDYSFWRSTFPPNVRKSIMMILAQHSRH